MECANSTKKATEVIVNKSSVIVNQMLENAKKQFASGNVGHDASNES